MAKVKCKISFKIQGKEFNEVKMFSISRTVKYTEFLSRVKYWVRKTYGQVSDIDIMVEEFDGTNID